MMSPNESCQRDLWESKSLLENPLYEMLDPVVITSAWPSQSLLYQELTPVLADVKAVWDRQ